MRRTSRSEVMIATSFISPPQPSQSTGSTSKTRRMHVADPASPAAEVLVRVRSGVRLAELASAFPRVRFGSQAGDVVTTEAPLSALEALSDDARVTFVHASHIGKLSMDVVRSSHVEAGPIYVGALMGGTTSLGLESRARALRCVSEGSAGSEAPIPMDSR